MMNFWDPPYIESHHNVTSCNVTDYQLWRGQSSETQGQLVWAGKKFEEKFRKEKSRTFDFPSPNFFLARSGF